MRIHRQHRRLCVSDFSNGANEARFQWPLGDPGDEFGLYPSEFSNLVFATADGFGGFTLAATGFGVNAGPSALVPTTSPEPGSLVLLGLAMVVGGAGYGRKRRKQKAAQK